MLPFVSSFPSFKLHLQPLLYHEGNMVKAISLILHEQSLEHKTRLLILAMLNFRVGLTLETPHQIWCLLHSKDFTKFCFFLRVGGVQRL